LKRTVNIFLRISALLIAVVVVIASRPFANTSTVDNHSVLAGLFKGVAGIKTLDYTMIQTERLDGGKTHIDSASVKFQRTPHKIFMRLSGGNEILWSADDNNGEAWVHPNSFPYVTLQLDPDGAIMRKDQHHGVQYAGYDYFEKVLERASVNAGKDFDSRFLYLGEMTYNGKSCYKLVVLDPNFKFIPYTVLKGETVMSIAKKLWVNEYMILSHNDLSSYNDVSEGQTIQVPNDYAKEITLYIEKTTMLTLLLRIDDEKGLYEQYVFKNIKLNPTFADKDFSKDNKEYHF